MSATPTPGGMSLPQPSEREEPDWLEGIEVTEVGSGSWRAAWQTRCDLCGRFVNEGGAGVSWSQSWSYDYDGTPDLHDATFRCSPCTDTHGIKPTNCNESQSKYHGRNPGQKQNSGDGK